MITKEALLEKLTDYTVEHGMGVLGAVLILIIGFWLAKILSRATAKLMESKVNLDPLIEKVMVRCVYLLVIALTIITVLGQFGVETTSFIALLGASGIAVGLALQGTLSNVASGIMLLALRPFSVGHSLVLSLPCSMSKVRKFTARAPAIWSLNARGLVKSEPFTGITSG